MNQYFEIDSLPASPSGGLFGALPMALFDEIGCGLIVCDADGVLRFANHAARQEIAAGRLLSAGANRVQRAPGAGGDLDGALRQAAAKGRRTLVRLSNGNDRLMATTLPFRLPGVEQPLVLLMLGLRQPCTDLGLEMLAGSYGLTLAERRVLAALVREASPREIAEQNAVKLSTVRTQISSIRGKLGVRSIEALLLRTAELPPVASALRMAFGGRASAPSTPPFRAAA